MLYGLASKEQAVEIAIAVCDVIGHSTGYAVHMCVETAAAETYIGEYRDPTIYAAGTGLTQVDEGTFDWLKDSYKNHKFAKGIREKFGIDLSRVQYRELELSPVLAMIFCRLRYYKAKGSIPETLEGRASYWKKWYNSTAGKGTPQGYIEKVYQCDAPSLIEQVMKEHAK